MKKFKDCRLFFKLLSPKRKFLAIIKYPQLKELEKRFKVYLGSANPNKKRPCIFWKNGDTSKETSTLIFLTASKKTSYLVNLNFCYEKKKRCNFPFYSNSYVFETPNKRPFGIKLKGREFIEELINCGACENLDFLEEIKLF